MNVYYFFNFGILVGVSVPFTMVIALFAMALMVERIFSTSNELYSSFTLWYNLSISILSVLMVCAGTPKAAKVALSLL